VSFRAAGSEQGRLCRANEDAAPGRLLDEGGGSDSQEDDGDDDDDVSEEDEGAFVGMMRSIPAMFSSA